MFTTIYKPKSLDEFVGNKEAIKTVLNWLQNWRIDGVPKELSRAEICERTESSRKWKSNKKDKCALISGVCGIGKSLLVELALQKHNIKYINIEDDNYDVQNIKSFIKTQKDYYGKNNVLVINDIDSNSEHGFISNILEYIKESKIPIICICNNRYKQSIKPILNHCIDIKLVRAPYIDIYKFLYKIIQFEKIKDVDIKKIYEKTNGDIRFMLNTLQLFTYRSSARKPHVLYGDKKDILCYNIFETTGDLLKASESIDKKYEIYWSSNDLHTLMIQENYIENIIDHGETLSNLSYSADALSDADLIDKQFYNTQDNSLEPYIACNTINATSKCNKNSMIKFTQFLGKLSIKKGNSRFHFDPSLASGIEGGVVPKPRGRPKKVSENKPESQIITTKKPRGRPKKIK
jgi:replication factor C subunit 1